MFEPTEGRGCAPGRDPTPPTACTLASSRQQERRASEFQEVFRHLEHAETVDGVVRWKFRDSPGLEAVLRELVRREHECCRFFEFRLVPEGGAIIWETRTTDTARPVLEEFGRLPQTLRESGEPGRMRRALGRAGLAFDADGARQRPR